MAIWFTSLPLTDSFVMYRGLNLGEGRHGIARAVFHGKRGELHQRYRECHLSPICNYLLKPPLGSLVAGDAEQVAELVIHLSEAGFIGFKNSAI